MARVFLSYAREAMTCFVKVIESPRVTRMAIAMDVSQSDSAR